MPRLIETNAAESIELEELIDTLETGHFDPDDEECFASFGPALRKLGNNREFLVKLVMEELKQRCEGQVRYNQYSPQVIMLHLGSNYLLRANFWPGEHDSIVRKSGTDPFFYGVPHDHNFSFLTVGYLGPGYWSDYYEYDYDQVTGHAGEKVDLRFIERSKLDLGKVMLYRAHKDVHLQLPADSLSMSLNILAISRTQEFRNQYRFDVEKSEVAAMVNRSSLAAMLTLSAHLGGGNGLDLLESFAASHPSDRIRFAAVRAKASAAGGVEARLSIYEQAARSDNAYVSAMARRDLKLLQTSRSWIEAPAQDMLPAFG
jgi:hypothetical protein